MELANFIKGLESLSMDDIRALAIDIDAMTATPAEEVDITKAFLHIEATLRRAHRRRDAAVAGYRATQAVLRAAEQSGASLPDSSVTRVARWAATVARGIIAERDADADVALFAHGCDHVAGLADLIAA